MSEHGEARISELESQVAFLEDAVATLDQEVLGQLHRLERLEIQLAELHRRQQQLAARDDTSEQIPEPPPPHY